MGVESVPNAVSIVYEARSAHTHSEEREQSEQESAQTQSQESRGDVHASMRTGGKHSFVEGHHMHASSLKHDLQSRQYEQLICVYKSLHIFLPSHPCNKPSRDGGDCADLATTLAVSDYADVRCILCF